ncbi:MAG: hemolysin family protein [Acidimicrobiales bacterium]
MTPTDLPLLALVFVLWAVAAFLAISETALTSMSKVKAMTLHEEGRRGAAALVKLTERREQFLAPVLLLVLLCHLVAATVLGILFDGMGSTVVTLVTFGQVLFVFVFIESAPKTWAILHNERSALLTAPIINAITSFPLLRLLTRGLISFTNVILPGKGLKEGPYISEQELLALADVAVEEDVIENEERALIHSIIEFGDTVVREVMVPRPDMVAVEGADKIGDVIEVAMQAGYSRIPVYEQGIDDIAGVVYTKDLIRAVRDSNTDAPVRTLVRDAVFVPELKRVAELMREMQKETFHIAVVVDEYGGTAGLVTLEDLIEELVGEIVDEFDIEEANVEPLPNGDIRVNARMPVDEVNDLVSGELPEGDWDSIGGLMFHLLGHVPSEGESVPIDGFELRAEKIQGRRIGKVRITRLIAAPEPEAN